MEQYLGWSMLIWQLSMVVSNGWEGSTKFHNFIS